MALRRQQRVYSPAYTAVVIKAIVRDFVTWDQATMQVSILRCILWGGLNKGQQHRDHSGCNRSLAICWPQRASPWWTCIHK
jgi:hypothetical protein